MHNYDFFSFLLSSESRENPGERVHEVPSCPTQQSAKISLLLEDLQVHGRKGNKVSLYIMCHYSITLSPLASIAGTQHFSGTTEILIGHAVGCGWLTHGRREVSNQASAF